MMDDLLPPGDHVARFCKGKFISEDDRVEPGAFMLRKDEGYLSVQWLECLGKPSRREEISEVRKILSGHLKIRRPSKIAVLNVGKTCDHVSQGSGWNIRMLHKPEQNDCAHSGIYGTNQDHELIAELITEPSRKFIPLISDSRPNF
jgi:hypothetical protein